MPDKSTPTQSEHNCVRKRQRSQPSFFESLIMEHLIIYIVLAVFLLAVIAFGLDRNSKTYELRRELESKPTESELLKKFRDELHAKKKASSEELIRSLINKPVLVVSNVWENPVIGQVIGIEFITTANEPVPVVLDYITQKELICLGHFQPCTKEKLPIFISMTPSQRWYMMADRASFNTFGPTENTSPILTADEIVEKLDKSGFMKLLPG